MPDFVYAPEGAEPQRWDFDPTRLMSPEAEAIEHHTGMTFGDWITAIQNLSVTAMHGFLYVMLKRKNPRLKWDEVQFCLADVSLEASDGERSEQRRTLEGMREAGNLNALGEAALAKLIEDGVELPDEDAPKEG